jgi:hypothetical protein
MELRRNEFDHPDDVITDREYGGGMRECMEIINRYNKQYDELHGPESVQNNINDNLKTGNNRFQHLFTKPFFERPFTKIIDREIEHQSEKEFHHQQKQQESVREPMVPYGIPSKPRPPLEEPAFSSTPWTKDEVESRTPAEHFQPLVPEPTGPTCNFHDHLDDRKFLAYYKRLTPQERKEQLVAQKEALMREQARLREVLREQEALLAEKQEQLKVQFDVYRNI